VEVVKSSAPFTLGDDPSVRRVVDFELHSDLWLKASVAQSGQVEDEALQAAITVSSWIEAR